MVARDSSCIAPSHGENAATAPLARPVQPVINIRSLWEIGGQVMAYASARPAQSSPSSARRGVRELLFKPDHPRAIDRHIDYFGGAAEPGSDAETDLCGELVLERPA